MGERSGPPLEVCGRLVGWSMCPSHSLVRFAEPRLLRACAPAGCRAVGRDEAKWSSPRLAAQSELLDEHAVALHVLLAEVAELPTPPADELE